MYKFFNSESTRNKPTKIGIFGGMGPLTGAEFYKRLEFSIPVTSDELHPIIYLLSDPTIPRRDAGVLNALNGEIPLDLIKRLANGLKYFKEQSVDFVVCPCNTFHYFREELEMLTKVKILNMIEIVAEDISKKFPFVSNITIFSTIATAKSQLYDKEFLKHGISINHLCDLDRKTVMKIIELVKAGKCDSIEVISLFCNLIESLESQGVRHILLGCTELSLVPVLTKYHGKCTIIDSMNCLVDGTIIQINQYDKIKDLINPIKYESKL